MVAKPNFHTQRRAPARAIVSKAGRSQPRDRATMALLAEHCKPPFDVLHAFWTSTGPLSALACPLFRGLVVLGSAAVILRLADFAYDGVLRARDRPRLWFACQSPGRRT